MALRPLIILAFLFFSFSPSPTVCSNSEHPIATYSVFLSSLNNISEDVKGARNQAHQLLNGIRDIHLSNAINDCLESFDKTMDVLMSSQLVLKNPNGTYIKTGNPSSDIKTWLSAALVNQHTCIESLEGTNNIVKDIMVNKSHVIRSNLEQVLGDVPQIPYTNCSVMMNGKVKNTDFPSWRNADVVVAKDGSGNFTTIMDAISTAPDNSVTKYVIHVKRGVYDERVVIGSTKQNLVLIGDGVHMTIITGNLSVIGNGVKTFDTAIMSVSGWGFIARDMTIENTAGPDMGQAVALLSQSDLSVFYRCNIRGYQDTLYAHSMRQFYQECQISGHIDFIFGYGKAVFQNCLILSREGSQSHKHSNTITAQGRLSLIHDSGFSFQFCNISAVGNRLVKSIYLGRPWKTYSTTVIMQSYLSNAINPNGWRNWNETMPGSDTLFYGEYMNYGLGARVSERVNWRGFHLLNHAQAINYTVAQLIDGYCWLPSTGVMFKGDL